MTESMIVEAVRAVSGNGGMPSDGGLATQAIDPTAVEQFEAAMDVDGPTPIPFAEQVAATWKTAEVNYQGILHRIKSLSAIREQHYPSIAELSEMQYEVANLAFQQEVATNIAKKSSDAVSTLVKNG